MNDSVTHNQHIPPTYSKCQCSESVVRSWLSEAESSLSIASAVSPLKSAPPCKKSLPPIDVILWPFRGGGLPDKAEEMLVQDLFAG